MTWQKARGNTKQQFVEWTRRFGRRIRSQTFRRRHGPEAAQSAPKVKENNGEEPAPPTRGLFAHHAVVRGARVEAKQVPYTFASLPMRKCNTVMPIA